jgi:FkbH-like protein
MHARVIYETRGSEPNVSEKVLSGLAERARRTELRSCLVWSEHCTECVWPTCYTTCALYTPRADLKCRRFVNGFERVVSNRKDLALEGYVAVAFRTWGKLEAEGSVRLAKSSSRRLQERLDQIVAQFFDRLPASFGVKVALVNGWNRLKTRIWMGSERVEHRDAFAVECYNERTTRVNCRLRMIDASSPDSYFESHFCIEPGYNFLTFGADRIMEFVDLNKTMRVQIEPIDHDGGNRIVFSLLDFVRMSPEGRSSAIAEQLSPGLQPSGASDAATPILVRQTTTLPKVKCVVWDLDNTIWNGILIEDGPQGIKLRAEVTKIIAELDRRGILQSIASKNDRKDAEAALERCGLMDYFVFPQINWEPKSQSILQIAKMLNIGEDTFVFIDDQPFEREEVRSANPGVRVVDAASLETFLDRADLDVPITAEGSRRRMMYKEEVHRTIEFNKTNGKFLEFLRASQLKLTIQRLDDETMERAFELTQRTNQLNYGGRQLSKLELEKIATLKTSQRGLVLSCRDRFGDYGIIGFAVLDTSNWTIEDFFMSCRVQRKKVENAFVAHLAELAKSLAGDTIRVRYRPSKRNGPALEMLTEMKFERVRAPDDADLFVLSTRIPDADVVEVEDRAVSYIGNFDLVEKPQ